MVPPLRAVALVAAAHDRRLVYLLEPLLLHDMFRRFALENPKRAYEVALRLHAVALLASVVVIGAGVMGAHGAIG